MLSFAKFYIVRRRIEMRRGVRVFAAIALTAAVGVSACAKKKPDAAAAGPATGRRAAARPRPPPPPPPPPAPREAAPRTPTEDEIFAQQVARRR